MPSPTGTALIWTQKIRKTRVLNQCCGRRGRHNKYIRLQKRLLCRALRGRHWLEHRKHSKPVFCSRISFPSVSYLKSWAQQIHQLLNTIPVLSPTGKTLIWTQKNSKNPRFLQLLLLCQCFTRRDRHNKHIRLQMRALQGRHWFQLSKHSKHVLFLS